LAIFLVTILPCDVLCRLVPRSWFAILFANSRQLKSTSAAKRTNFLELRL